MTALRQSKHGTEPTTRLRFGLVLGGEDPSTHKLAELIIQRVTGATGSMYDDRGSIHGLPRQTVDALNKILH